MRRAALYASVAGLSLGMAILAGRLHMAMMQAVVVFSAVAFAGWHPGLRLRTQLGKAWVRPVVVLVVVAGVAFSAGAVQLLISAEYSPHAFRFFGDVPPLRGNERVPSTYPDHGLWPSGLWAILFPYAYDGKVGGGEVLGFYLGVFPLLAAIIGIWKRWETPWVRYLAGLAVVAFLYSLAACG